ncbi:MAG: hypothetical protein MI748_00600, partial [Opitutales bacterium]|nr:hypothetical protein [Opitutales bacterium]
MKITKLLFLVTVVSAAAISNAASTGRWDQKPTPDEALKKLKEGNIRFVMGDSQFPNISPERLAQAGAESQADHAFATVVSSSDSRVPVELLFDAGVMDILVIRIAGNVCDVNVLGSIEYGLAHVHTPLLVILGNTQCDVVTAVTHEVQGRGRELEANIRPLMDNIVPAVKKAIHEHPTAGGDAVIPYAIEENVWQSVKAVLERSPASRALIESGKVKVVGAIYDVSNGGVRWLPQDRVEQMLKEEVHLNSEKGVEEQSGSHEESS